MDLQHIKPVDWHVFEKSFPSAAAFLLDASLRGELAALNTSPVPLNNWQKDRQKELTELFIREDQFKKEGA